MESAVLLLVPEAEPLVGPWRARGDPASARGIPAHVTLLYPFVPEPDGGVAAELRRFFAAAAPFPLTFRRVDSFGDEVLWLAPDQAEQCRRLTHALAAEWPACPPYGGQFPTVTPHLTLVARRDAELQAAAREAVGRGLPIVSTASQASLFVRSPDGHWRESARFPFGPD